MAQTNRGQTKVWSHAATPSATEWRDIMAVFKDKKWKRLEDRLVLLRDKKGPMSRRKFGLFNRHNSLLRAAKSPFRIQFIGTGRSLADDVAIVRLADGVDRMHIGEDTHLYTAAEVRIMADDELVRALIEWAGKVGHLGTTLLANPDPKSIRNVSCANMFLCRGEILHRLSLAKS